MFAYPPHLLLWIRQSILTIVSVFAALYNKGDPPPSVCVCPSAALPARRCVFEAVPLAHSDAYRWRQMALTAGLPLTPLILILLLLLLLLLLVSPSNCHYEDAPNVGSYAQNLLRY